MGRALEKRTVKQTGGCHLLNLEEREKKDGRLINRSERLLD